MTRNDLPRISMSTRPTGLKFKAPAGAVARWDKSIAMATKPAAGEIAILGYIGDEGNNLADVRKQLKQIGRGNLRLILSSPGGDAFEGINIFNELKDHPGQITTVIRGMAASAASVIAMAGDRIEMGEAALMMIHGASGLVMGNAADMEEFAELLDMIDGEVAALYARRTGRPLAEIKAMMRKDTYLTAKQAVEKGFADVAVAEPKEKQASASMRSSLPALATSALLAASGNQHVGIRMSAHLPGVSGNFKGITMKTLHDQLAELRETKQAKMVRLGEINQRMTSGERLEEAERQEFDSLDTELVSIDDQIRSKSFELRMSQEARPVQQQQGQHRGAPYLNLKVKDQDEKFKGQNFTRKIIARAAAFLEMQSGNFVSPGDIAQARWGKTNPTLVNVIRMAAVPGFGTGSGEPGSELVTSDTRYTGDFLEFLYGMTVFDRLPLREVPAYVTIKGTDGAAIGYWVGESKAIPATNGSASAVQLTPLKVAAIAPASNELLRYADPSAELWIRDLLVNAIAQRIDTTFLSASAASAGVSPAGILNGVSAGTSAGTSADNVRTDLMVLAQNFIDNKNASNLWLVTSPGLLLALNMLTNALGQPEFSGITPDGGNLRGYRILSGDNVGSGDVIMLKPDEIWKIGDTGLQVSFSRDATIEQQTDPTGATDTPTGMTTTNMTSAFQEDSTFIKVVRPISFAKRRTHAVAFIGDAGYGGVAS